MILDRMQTEVGLYADKHMSEAGLREWRDTILISAMRVYGIRMPEGAMALLPVVDAVVAVDPQPLDLSHACDLMLGLLSLFHAEHESLAAHLRLRFEAYKAELLQEESSHGW